MSRRRDEPVRLTKIYTRGGDKGETSRGDGKRVPKTDRRIAAYGTVDELNSHLGLALASDDLPPEFRPWLEEVQNDLFDVGADLCLPISDDPPYPPLRITEKYVERLESWCDEFNERLPKLTSFILPGGTPGAAFLHQARTVARRAERSAWALCEAEPDTTNPVAVKYLNRLSDLLFILARLANPEGDVLWRPGGQS